MAEAVAADSKRVNRGDEGDSGSWKSLAQDILARVCNELSSNEQMNLRLVCRDWRISMDLNKCKMHITKNTLQHTDLGTINAALRPRFPFLRKIVVTTTINLEDILPWAQMPKLRSLYLRDCKVENSHTCELSAFSRLTELHLSKMVVDLNFMENIGVLTNLKKLGLTYLVLGNGALNPISQLANLTSLNLRCTCIKDMNLLPLRSLTSLTELDLGMLIMRKEGMEHLTSLSQLQTLSLHGSQVSDVGLAKLCSSATSLVSLDLSSSSVSGETLKHLTNLKNLSFLDLGWTRVRNADLACLQGLCELMLLNLEWVTIGR